MPCGLPSKLEDKCVQLLELIWVVATADTSEPDKIIQLLFMDKPPKSYSCYKLPSFDTRWHQLINTTEKDLGPCQYNKAHLVLKNNMLTIKAPCCKGSIWNPPTIPCISYFP